MKRPIKVTISACLVGAVLLGGAFAAGVLAERSSGKITVDGKAVEMEGYQIDGHNYFKLRDVAQAVGFGVTWNNTTGTVEIDTGSGYVPEASTAAKSSAAKAPVPLSVFSGLDIDVGIADVYVQTGEGYSVSLESHGQDKNGTPYELHYTNEKGRLNIWSTPRQLSTEGDISLSGKVVVTVPAGVSLGMVGLELGMGNFTWTDCGLTDGMDCDLGMGDAILSGDLSGDVHLELGMGGAKLSGAMSGDIELNLGMGDAELSGDLTGDVRVNAGMGDISVTLTKAASHYRYELNVADYMGTIRLDGKKLGEAACHGGTGSSRLALSSGMGDVSLTFGG